MTSWSGSPRDGSCACAACTAMTGPSSASAGARGRRSTWQGSITPRFAAARSWRRPAFSRQRASCRSHLTPSAGAIRPFHHRGRYKLHLGTAEVSAVLSLLETDESSSGQPRLAQLFVAEPVVAVHGQPFVLRAESPPATLGGGRVLQPSPGRIRRRDRAAIDRLGRLRAGDPVERVRAALAFGGLAPSSEPATWRNRGCERQRARTRSDGTDRVGGHGRSAGRTTAIGPRAGGVCRRSRGSCAAGPGPAARGPSSPFSNPACPARCGVP